MSEHESGALAPRLAVIAAAMAIVTGGALPGGVARAVGAREPGTLAAAAAASGRYFGTALEVRTLADNAYVEIASREFNAVTPAYQLSWDATQPSPTEFRFHNADQVVNFAMARGAAVRGGYLMWHSALPAWIASTSIEIRPAVKNHITTVVRRFKGKVRTWDVVAEAFLDGDTGRRRPSVFQNRMGDTWIEESFTIARAADPEARLCYADYGIDDPDAVKTEAVYAMVKDFKARGVPIDCVGLQSHFDDWNKVPADYRRTIERFAALGVEVVISELDIKGSGTEQAERYRQVVAACVAVAKCRGITVWGVRDSDSWRPQFTPLLFDRDGNKKPAYHATLAALGGAAPPKSLEPR